MGNIRTLASSILVAPVLVYCAVESSLRNTLAALSTSGVNQSALLSARTLPALVSYPIALAAVYMAK